PRGCTVAEDSESFGGHLQEVRTPSSGPGRIPGQGLAGRGIDCSDSGPAYGPRTLAVAGVGVVQPALMAADIDGVSRYEDAVQRVAAGVVHPCRDTAADDRGAEPRDRVADSRGQRSGRVS